VNSYHEFHFAVIREIYKNTGPTRYDIWVAVYGEPVPRDDSAEADLYKLLIRDLNIGGVIRQPRESDEMGRYRKVRRPRRWGIAAGGSQVYVTGHPGNQKGNVGQHHVEVMGNGRRTLDTS
jgi:hypothetical protein